MVQGHMVNVVFCEAVLAVACSLAVSAGLMLCQAIPCPLAPPSAACAFEYCSLRENQVHVGCMQKNVKDLEFASIVPVAADAEQIAHVTRCYCGAMKCSPHLG